MTRVSIRVGLTMLAILLTSCRSVPEKHTRGDINRRPDKTIMIETTGYCPCEICCGWEKNSRGVPVFKSGPNKGKRKVVGMTASGKMATVGTIAADTNVYPFGTRMYVEGYGWGTVEDRGGAIKGRRLDLYFETHEEALQWGRRKVKVGVWKKR